MDTFLKKIIIANNLEWLLHSIILIHKIKNLLLQLIKIIHIKLKNNNLDILDQEHLLLEDLPRVEIQHYLVIINYKIINLKELLKTILLELEIKTILMEMKFQKLEIEELLDMMNLLFWCKTEKKKNNFLMEIRLQKNIKINKITQLIDQITIKIQFMNVSKK